MKKYFSEYIAYLLAALDSDNPDELKKLMDDLLNKISFMQHERLIHLIVLCLFAVLLFVSLTAFFISMNTGMLAAAVLMLLLLVPYISHYYFLENNVQKLYSIYDTLKDKLNSLLD